MQAVRSERLARQEYLRQASGEQACTEDGENSSNVIELFQRAKALPEGRAVVRLDVGHGPEGKDGEDGPDDGEQYEGGAPVEDLGRDTAQDGPEHETQGVSRAKGREGSVLALRRRRVGGAQNADRGGDHHGGRDAQHAAHDQHPERVLRERHEQGEEAKACHSDYEHGLPA